LNKIQTRGKNLITLLLLVLLSAVLLNTPNFLIKYGEAQQPTTIIKVVPSQVSIVRNSSTTINVTITNVANLFAWQVEMFFNKTVLNTTTASIGLPPDHVFAGKDIVPLEPVVQDYTSDFSLYPRRYLFFGASLYSEPLFSGSGTLFQVNFTGVGFGASNLNLTLHPPGALGISLLDYDLNDIPFTVENGRIEVLGAPPPGVKANSQISLEVSPDTVTVGSNVTISGKITTNETKTGVDVKIYYNATGGAWPNWPLLKTVPTGTDSRYTYIWTTNQTGTYQVKAKWEGDVKTYGNESITKTVKVQSYTPPPPPPPTDITPYIIIGVVAGIIVVVIVVYFVKFRKPKSTAVQSP